MLIKKLFITVCAFVLALVTFATSTYAWFFLAQQVSVGDFNLTISNDKELLISLDGVTYQDSISADDLADVIGDNLQLNNVTTLDGNTFYSSYTHDSKPIKNRDYISFDIWFRTDSDYWDGVYLYNNISSNYNYAAAMNQELKGTFVFSKGINYQTTVDFQYSQSEFRKQNTINKYYASDAIRIGINEQYVDSVELVEEDSREEKDLASFIYDPSENEERGFGKTYGALDMFQRKMNKILTVPDAPETKLYLSNLQYNYYAIDNTSLCGTFHKATDGYYYAKANVSLWLEGWDADCLDAIYADMIIMQLQFKCAIKAQETK